MNCIFPVFFYGLSSESSSSSPSVVEIVLLAIIGVILGVALFCGDDEELITNVRCVESPVVLVGDDGTVVTIDNDGNVVTVNNDGTVVPVEE